MSIFLSNYIIALMFIQAIIVLLASYALYTSINILKKWDFESVTQGQYALEKRSYLVATTIVFIIIIKIILFFFFVICVDNLSNIVPGAMCAAGIVSANEYGTYLLGIKIFSIFGFGIWLYLNKLDIEASNYPFLMKKYFLYLVLFLLIIVEFWLEITYFANISLEEPVKCCSIVFSAATVVGGLPLGFTTQKLIILFYLLYVLSITSSLFKYSFYNFITNLMFLFVAYYSVTYFFGTYIYEIPTHKCPYCMLQKEYYFIGYIIWTALFIGVFFGMLPFIMQLLSKKSVRQSYLYSILFNTFFVLVCTYFVVAYYLKNGVFL